MSPLSSSHRHRSARRRAQRGLTVYVVLLVIAMLSAVGIFASRSASLATAQSGHFRQMMQTHYVTELAVLTTIAAIETDTPGYVSEMERHSIDEENRSAVVGEGWRPCRAFGENRRCYKFGREGIEQRLTAQNGAAVTILEARPDSSAPLATPGSLGRADVEAHFMVDATDLAQVVAPISGQRATDAPVTFYAVTLSATAEVGPPTPEGDDDPDAAFRSAAISLETARVHLTLGPLPTR